MNSNRSVAGGVGGSGVAGNSQEFKGAEGRAGSGTTASYLIPYGPAPPAKAADVAMDHGGEGRKVEGDKFLNLDFHCKKLFRTQRCFIDFSGANFFLDPDFLFVMYSV